LLGASGLVRDVVPVKGAAVASAEQSRRRRRRGERDRTV